MILKAREKDLNEIAILHRTVLSHTSSSRFGKKFVKKLYRILLDDKNSIVWIYKIDNNIVGFLSVTSNTKSTANLVKENILGKDYINMLYFFIKNPYEVLPFIKRIYFDLFISRSLISYPNILTIGVSPKYQGLKIGTKLITKADNFFKKSGFDSYYVDTEQVNFNAIKFYKHNNFKIIKSFSGNVLLEKKIN